MRITDTARSLRENIQSRSAAPALEAIWEPTTSPLSISLIPAVTVALSAYVVPIVAFIELAERVSGDAKLPFDKPIMLWFREQHSLRRTQLVQAVTQLGGVVAVPTVAVLTAAHLFLVHGRKRPAALLSLSLLGSTAINNLLKFLYRRARPSFFRHIVNERSYSFPSGHAMSSAAAAVCAGVLAWPTPWRISVITVAALYVPVIGATRVYLGVHYPSDILAGWSVSVTWVSIVATIMWLVDHRDSRGVSFRTWA